MATKANAIANVKSLLRNRPDAELYIYRIGPAWMFTSESQETVQARYKSWIREYQRIEAKS